MRVERLRDNVFTVTATSQELSALVAGAPEALQTLQRVLADYDSARERLGDEPPAGG